MAQQIINVGTIANDGTGDTIRSAMTKTNSNFTEVYGKVNTLETNLNSLVVSGLTAGEFVYVAPDTSMSTVPGLSLDQYGTIRYDRTSNVDSLPALSISDTLNTVLSLVEYSDSGSNAPALALVKRRGSVSASEPTIAGDLLGVVSAIGVDGTSSGRILWKASSTTTAENTDSLFEIQTKIGGVLNTTFSIDELGKVHATDVFLTSINSSLNVTTDANNNSAIRSNLGKSITIGSAPASTVPGGQINIEAGNSNYGSGGNVDISAGWGNLGGTGGHVLLRGGIGGSAVAGGNIYLIGGNSQGQDETPFSSGYPAGPGGFISIQGGIGTVHTITFPPDEQNPVGDSYSWTDYGVVKIQPSGGEIELGSGSGLIKTKCTLVLDDVYTVGHGMLLSKTGMTISIDGNYGNDPTTPDDPSLRKYYVFNQNGVVFPDGNTQTGASISIIDLKTLVADSTDFADFQARIAAL